MFSPVPESALGGLRFRILEEGRPRSSVKMIGNQEASEGCPV
jgi:hypothetical protein